MPDFLEEGLFKNAYLGKHALALVMQTSTQMEIVYQLRGLIIPLQVSSVLQYLAGNDGSATADIARQLKIPHQLVAQRAKVLLDLDLIERRKASDDARRVELFLTESGRQQASLLMDCMLDTASIYEELFAEIGVDLIDALLTAAQHLEARSLRQRFAEKFKSIETTGASR